MGNPPKGVFHTPSTYLPFEVLTNLDEMVEGLAAFDLLKSLWQ